KEKETFIRGMVRQLRRQQGLKEEGTISVSAPITNAAQTDLFAGGSKGEWYFYNAKVKTQGAAAFQQQWGKRPNVDNWRRSNNVVAQMRNEQPNNTRGNPQQGEGDLEMLLTYEGLAANLPTTSEDLQASNDSILSALYLLGRMYINEVEDFEAAAKTYEELRRRFPNFEPKDEVLFHLYYAYTKLGESAKAAEMKSALTTQYADSRYSKIVTTGVDPESTEATAEATKAYEDVYNLFIEGRFAEAKRAKQAADSMYNTTYWSPQLLYIEAVHHIQLREDSLAQALLPPIVQQNDGTPMPEKATILWDVLSRRAQIEEELRNLQIERPVEEKQAVVIVPEKPKVVEDKKEELVAIVPEKPKVEEKKEEEQVAVTRTQQVAKDTSISRSQPVTITDAKPKTGVDTVLTPGVQPQKTDAYTYNPNSAHYVVVVLNKVDVVFGNEARNAFNRYHREKYSDIPLQATLQPLTDDDKLLLLGEFTNIQAAIDYVQKAKPVAATEIMPWLKGDKYSFTIISADNLKLLQEKKNLDAYRLFLDQNLPVKF
ncbi:MAG: tetratricopeptide repeat protein, partial [Chitinophagaceae bacterium]